MQKIQNYIISVYDKALCLHFAFEQKVLITNPRECCVTNPKSSAAHKTPTMTVQEAMKTNVHRPQEQKENTYFIVR